MNTNRIYSRGALVLTLGLFLWTMVGCKHSPPKNTTPVTDVQAPLVRNVSRPSVDSREKEFQQQIDAMQEQVAVLSARTESLARFHGLRMGPKWVEKVQAARDDASRPSERVRYLEATKALLARKLEALRTELKVYEEFQSSDPAIPRP